ncbi:MAG: hypothetical protein HYR56_02665 [Acidobacteria bacterium]|nr:hypothetical protein [Acidobacteriota bacterium]MBI3425543.1 hypothetical protein [Acidobacteriota bacterium]
MKLLITAKWLSLDKTSEAICTSKVIKALDAAGHEILCLTSDPAFVARTDWFTLPWLGAARVLHIRRCGQSPPALKLDKLRQAIAARGALGAQLARKLDTALAYATGYRTSVWQEVSAWRHAIQTVAHAEQPDCLYIRGAGVELEPHLAMLDRPVPQPWVAHYHDPFPMSRFPEPYRYEVPLLARRQEALHRNILRQADALTFPSQRLLEWVLPTELAATRAKAVVIPHLGMDLPGDEAANALPTELQLDGSQFNLVHAGTLLGPRLPWALIDGFLEFLKAAPARQAQARLWLIGKANSAHLKDPRWQAAAQHPNIKLTNQRILYGQSITLLRAATATVVLEAEAQESPFFPAKLADYLWHQKPILALSPKPSVTADILGRDYPLIVTPGDARGVQQALNALWEAWESATLNRFVLGAETLNAIHADTVVAELTRLFTALTTGQSVAEQKPATVNAHLLPLQ